ncbi:sulfotransferase [Alteromonas sp. 1_MG-2023]|uniref:sulfotransferase family protein n=1 Tax=Alteromonas sp. 1_MG-2023 TaxID=3062669 RepID=UPI0026E1DD27|nr:sulfotransferase [Alteromonas sp. 1_MG-2023]MDO6476478.1 sulfotransferase [Alteromonas sp. 1_MG-2023]
MSYPSQMLKPLMVGECAEGAPPYFIGLGTPKAGTSWWYHLLMMHPQIKDNNFGVKETCYYCHNWPEENAEELKQQYQRGFTSEDSGTVTGEWSTLYLSHPFALKRLIEDFPEARYLLLFRDPIDTLNSWLNQLMRNRAKKMLKDDDASRFMYLNYDAIPSLFAQIMRYPTLLHELQNVAGLKLLCLQYEQNAADIQTQYDKTTDFLGLQRFELNNADVQINTADSNLVAGLVLPEVVKNDLKACARELLKMCPDFEPSLWQH